jgi:hypothetical protein
MLGSDQLDDPLGPMSHPGSMGQTQLRLARASTPPIQTPRRNHLALPSFRC